MNRGWMIETPTSAPKADRDPPAEGGEMLEVD
jgi:hypothetical protein